ncbi:type II secretion system GspH family protein [bacterium]|nr:type II secretion system GspH family protein [bacterium]
MYKFKRNTIGGERGGFTLIELLVVIAIIAILSTVVMAGLNSARAKGRDANRVAAVKQIQSALELYSDTCSGYPPNTAAAITGSTDANSGLSTGENDGSTTDSCPSGTTFATFMAVLPTNPGPGGEAYTYCGTANALSAITVANPLVSSGATDCGATGAATGYLVGFNLEGSSGTLLAGDRNAGPGGIK